MSDTAYKSLAQLYDRFMRDVPYTAWVEWTTTMWQKHWGRLPHQSVDLGCGTGNITIPLAQSGVSMIGIDLSEEMLACASVKWENMKQNGDVSWLHMDMKAWALPHAVDSVIAFCDAFNYLTEVEDFTAALRCAYEGLRPGGLLLFDLLPEQRFITYAEQQPFVVDEGDLAYFWFCDYEADRNCIVHDLTFFIEEGELFRKQNEIHIQRAYDPTWVLDQLKKIGYKDVELYTGLFPSAAELSDRYFFKAVKAL